MDQGDPEDCRRESMKPVASSRYTFRLGALLGAPILSALLMNGCIFSSERDPASPAADAPSGSADPAQGAAVLASLGYPKDQIKPVEGGFIVQGDMFFGLSDLNRSQKAPLAKTAQRQSTPISSPAPNRVTVTIHGSMSDWGPYVSQAVNDWNSVNTRLHLQLVPSGGNIVIYSDTSASCPAAFRNLADGIGGIANVALGGTPGASICINKDSPALTNDPIRVMTVTHELGHTIGFYHTDSNSGTLIPGTPVTDGSSLMGSSGSPGRVLSAEDIKALEIMYPSDKPLGGTDLDGDHKDDIVVWRPSDGRWYALASSTNFTSGFFWQWGQRGDMPMADMDMDGDGIDDKVVWRPGDGFWYAVLSATNTVRSIQWGQAGDLPISNHDMDGDGKDDLVFWRWKEAKFYVRTSSSNFNSSGSFAFGALGDIPVGGIDADRDGKDDWVLWRPTEGRFYVKFSSTGFTTSASFLRGSLGDIPVGSTDLDRDGKDDLTVFRLGTASWSALLSGDNFVSQRSLAVGVVGAVPVIGTDIDQDGLRDLTIWNPANGTWTVKTSSANFASNLSFVWGQ
jgi:hypothetical protein